MQTIIVYIKLDGATGQNITNDDVEKNNTPLVYLEFDDEEMTSIRIEGTHFSGENIGVVTLASNCVIFIEHSIRLPVSF